MKQIEKETLEKRIQRKTKADKIVRSLLFALCFFSSILIFIVIFFIIQQIEGHIVYPKVVGSSVGLPALWTLLAVVVGGKVSGVFGIILFIPLFSVIYALVRRSVYSRLRRKGITISE